MIALTVIAWSALIAPKMVAADPLAFFHDFTPLVQSNEAWSLQKGSVIASSDGKHAAGIVGEMLHSGVMMAVMCDQKILGRPAPRPLIAFAPKTDQLFRLYGQLNYFRINFPGIPVNTRVPEPISSVLFSPEGKQFAYVGKDANKRMIVHNGVVGPPMRRIDHHSIQFGKDTIAYAASDGSTWRMIIDRFVDTDYTAVRDSLAVSPQGNTAAYLAIRDGKWHVIRDLGLSKDGKRNRLVSQGFMLAKSPVIVSDDGSVTAAWVQIQGGIWQLAINGKINEAYATTKPGNIAIRQDGKQIAAAIKSADGRWQLIVDGKLIATCDGIGENSLRYTQSQKHLIAGMKWNGLWYLCVDGKLGEPSTAMMTDAYQESPNDTFLYAGRTSLGRWRVMQVDLAKNNQTVWRSSEYDGIQPGSLVISPDQQRVAFVGRYDSRACLVVGNQMLALRRWMGTPVFSPDSQHVAVLASKGQQFELLIDGKSVGEPFFAVLPSAQPAWDGADEVNVVIERQQHRFARLRVGAAHQSEETTVSGSE
ncbi:hypothetical protein [Poriferisphaera corsica]|nr:hypothetical protein [Poriferisphaera corsica]